MKFNNYYEA